MFNQPANQCLTNINQYYLILTYSVLVILNR